MTTLAQTNFDEVNKVKLVCGIDNCTKAFARANRLQMHKRTQHYGIDLFKCHFEGCTKAFAERGNL